MLSLCVPGGSRGAGQPSTIRLADHRLTVLGRLKPADWVDAHDTQFVVLDSPSLRNLTSRSHLSVTRRLASTSSGDVALSWTLADLNSMNGVLVNRTRVMQKELADGDTIIVGAAKNYTVGETIARDLRGVSDLVYRFYEDPDRRESEATTEHVDDQRGEQAADGSATHARTVSLRPVVAASVSECSPSDILSRVPSSGGSGGLRISRSYSFKPSARDRRAATNTPQTLAHTCAADNTEHTAAACSSPAAAASSTASPPAASATASIESHTSSSTAAAASTPTLSSAGSDGVSRPKLSLAAQLLSFVSPLNPFRSASPPTATNAADGSEARTPAAGASDTTHTEEQMQRRKRVREEIGLDGDDDRSSSQEEKRQRTEAVELEAARRRAIEADARTAAAESAVALARAQADSNAAAASKEARQALAAELSDEFQCCCCCDLIVLATALSCSHTFCKSCIVHWLTKGGTDGTGNLTCPQCRQTITSEPVAVRSLDNAIDRIAASSLTEEERRERQEKQTADNKLVMPKILKPKGGRATVAAAPRPTPPAARRVFRDVDDDDDDDDEEDGGEHVGATLRLEHAPSGRAMCRGCHSYIPFRAARFAVQTSSALGYEYYEYPESPRFWHLLCYVPNVDRSAYPRPNNIPGFARLNAAEKAELRRYLP